MRIGPMSPHHNPADLDSLYRSNESQTAEENRSASSEEHQKLLKAIQHNPTLTQILGDYDVRDIKVGDFSQMCERLELESLIQADSRELLAGVRGDLAGFKIGSDESVDLLDFYQTLVGRLESEEDLPAEASFDKKAAWSRFDWMQKFATFQSSPRAMGINAHV